MQAIDLYETLFDALTAMEQQAAHEYAQTSDPEAAHRQHRAQDALEAIGGLFPPCRHCGDCSIDGFCSDECRAKA